MATGFGLAPVTLGTSTILSAVGGAMCAAGGATAAGSSLVGSKIFKTKLAKVQEIIETDRQAQEPVEKLLNELHREVSELSRGIALDCLSYHKNLAVLIKKTWWMWVNVRKPAGVQLQQQRVKVLKKF